MDALNAFADTHQLPKPHTTLPALNYKALLKHELAAKQRPRTAQDPLSPSYIHNEILALKSWQARLRDPKFVFGEGKVIPGTLPNKAGGEQPLMTESIKHAANTEPGSTAPKQTETRSPASSATSTPEKHWKTQMQVTNAPLMQIIEHGFVQHDEMPTRAGAKDRTQAFNTEVTITLARFGFSPGATYRDTMHFDFIEGYSAAPGGRSPQNMKKNKYGASGDLPSSTDRRSPPDSKKDVK